LIKIALKEWQNLPGKIASLKNRMAALDCKAELAVLTEAECDDLQGITADLHSLSRLNFSICRQQARDQWLREGDANCMFFHSVMSTRRRRNALYSIMVDGELVEGVQPIHNVVFA